MKMSLPISAIFQGLAGCGVVCFMLANPVLASAADAAISPFNQFPTLHMAAASSTSKPFPGISPRRIWWRIWIRGISFPKKFQRQITHCVIDQVDDIDGSF